MLFVFTALVACDTSSQELNDTNEDNSKETSNNGSVTIDLAHSTASSDESHYQQFALKFKEEVETESNGEITIEIHPNGTLGAERDLIEGVEFGAIDAAIVSTGPLSNFTKLFEILDFPYLFDSSEHVHRVVDGEIGEEINDEISKNGLEIISWLDGGFTNITNSVRPIIDPDDLNGLKIRAQENDVIVKSIQSLGAEPTPMAFTEVYTALQQGVIEGQINVLPTIIPMNFHETQDYYSQIELYFITAPVLFNKELLDSLSAEHKEIIMNAAKNARDYEREFVEEMNSKYLNVLREDGLEVTTEFNREAFVEKVQEVYEQYEEEYGEYFEKIKELR